MTSPLSGIRVLELGFAIAGPHCCQILADHGADVIKIEPPSGDRSRRARPMMSEESTYFAAHNRGKRSVCLDLKSPDGLNAMKRLARTADVIVTNFGAGVPERLGWAYENLREENPRLIFVHITGYGHDSARRDVPAYDGTVQAMSGMPSLTGDEASGPMLVGSFVADHIAAQHAAMGVLLALQDRDRTGTGRFVDLSMFDAYFSMLAHDIAEADLGLERAPAGNSVPTCYSEAFEATDGRVFIAVLEQGAWDRLLVRIGHPDWVGVFTYLDDAMGWRRDSLTQVIAEWVSDKSRDEVMSALTEVRVACGAFRTVAEAVADELTRVDGAVRQVETPGGRTVHVAGPAIRIEPSENPLAWTIPALGAHTEEILAELMENDD